MEGELVRVLCRSGRSGLRPISFTRREQEYRVAAINARWTGREGVHPLHFYALSLEGGGEGVLCFASRSACWYLTALYGDEV